MNKKKMNALETICRKVLELGMDPEICLSEYPDYADELRPLLETAMNAKAAAPAAVPADVARRGRVRLLQQAAQMREAASAPKRGLLFDLRRVAIPLVMVLVFFISSTGLLQASASALPGDGLYGVKRSWENVHYWFADDEKIASLQATYEEERREEILALFDYGRIEAVQFEGIVISQNGSMWNVANVPVDVSSDTEVGASIGVGSDVIVSGETQEDGVVLATKIILSHPEEPMLPPVMTEDANDQGEEGEELETPESELEDDTGEETESEENGDDEESPTEISDEDDDDNDTTIETPEPENDDETDTGDPPGDDEEENSTETSDDDSDDDTTDEAPDPETGDEPDEDEEDS